jgi:hypothetical protein
MKVHRNKRPSDQDMKLPGETVVGGLEEHMLEASAVRRLLQILKVDIKF